MVKRILLIAFYLSGFMMIAQVSNISGEVYDEYLEPFTGAIIKSSDGKKTISEDGTFTLKNVKLPTTLTVSSQGYGIEKKEVTIKSKRITIILKETSGLEEVVVSASRTPERILESPVTVERLSFKDIKTGASVNFYDGLENLKGVDINISSLGFKSVNARGFAGFENPRFVQLIDGIDNMVPSLNYAMGNMAGVPDIDIESVEILPGAASALYGANAFNGVMLMKTKSPFDFQGVTVQFKPGMTKQEMAGNNPFYDTSIRMAYAFNDKLAAKATFSYFKGEEWHAGDTRSIGVDGLIVPKINRYNYSYNGVNIYGDEISRIVYDLTDNDLYGNANVPQEVINVDDAINLLNTANYDLFESLVYRSVSRTGYEEKYLTDYNAKKLNFNGSLHYRPFGNDKLELIWNSRLSQWDNLYQGRYRYQQKDFYMHQHKLEIKGQNFFARAYYSQNVTGKSYDLQRAGMNVSRLWYSDDKWFEQYAVNFVNKAMADDFPNKIKDPNIETIYTPLWNKTARINMDTHNQRFLPGTSKFNQAFNKVVSNTDPVTGAMQQDKTSFLNGDIQFNLKNYINWLEIIVGSQYRFYKLNSFGTIFTDKNKTINYDEHGTYLQLQKSVFDKRLRLTGSIRYDKTKNYDGNYSPRVALNYVGGKSREHNFRFSYQTAFRNPTAQEQYMLLATSPSNYTMGTSRNNIENLKVPYANRIFREEGIMTGESIYLRGFAESSVRKFLNSKPKLDPNTGLQSRDTKLLKYADYDFVKPEKLKTFEFGYRGLLKLVNNHILEIDFNAYHNTYNDLITEKGIVVNRVNDKRILEVSLPKEIKKFRKETLELDAYYLAEYRRYNTFKVKTNSQAEVNSWGATIGLKTKMFKNFDIGGSYSYTDFEYDEKEDPDFTPNFNTPKHKAKVQFGNRNLFKNFGFNIQARWQDKYYWVSPFVSGAIDARTMLDAQLNLRIPSMKSTFKLGGTNLTGKEYFSGPGTGAIGSAYYLSWTIND